MSPTTGPVHASETEGRWAAMAGFDPMTRGGTVARAADTCTYDVGIRDDRVAGLVQNLARNLAENFESDAAGGQ